MEKQHDQNITIAEVRDKLESGETGYWKSLDQLAEGPESQRWVEDEFPERASIPEVDRRTMLKVMGASLALAGLAGCRNLPQEKLVPYVKAPEDRIPGTSQYFATVASLGGYATGVLVESFDGRPTKIEGNPDHPSSLGSLDAITLASILNLYDPDRQTGIVFNGLPSSWDEFYKVARAAVKGGKVRILSGTETSPATIAWIEKFIATHPGTKWHCYESASLDNVKAGSQIAFGQVVNTVYDVAKADVIVSLDADFLGSMIGNVRYARDFSSRRDPKGKLNRLYAFQAAPSITGASADHVWSFKPSDIESIAMALGAKFGVGSGFASPAPEAVLEAVAADLRSQVGLVIAGPGASPAVHAIAHAINRAIGAPVTYTASLEGRDELQVDSLRSLVADMNAGRVDALLIAGVNPVYAAPADLKFGEALRKVKHSWRLGQVRDETSELCRWHLPEAHYLEAWGDARGHDGTVSIQQPLIEPLFLGKSLLEVVAALNGDARDALDLVQEFYKSGAMAANFNKDWQLALSKGVVENLVTPAVTVSAGTSTFSRATIAGTEAIFAPDPTVWDGQFSNNGWLQELPKPMTKLTWDNAVLIGMKMAEELGLKDEDMVTVTAGEASVKAGVMIQPGHPDGAVTLNLGYGRTAAGKVGNGTGWGFEALRTSTGFFVGNVQLAKASGRAKFACAQTHHSMEGRDLVREGSVAMLAKNPKLTPYGAHDEEDELTGTYYNLTEEWAKDSDFAQWAMTIDLNTCIGCNACSVACQSENNISTVGKTEVMRGREMHWIRIDRYYRVANAEHFRLDIEQDGFTNPHGPHVERSEFKKDVLDPNRISTVFQPVPCMQCEVAPCEPVCPVAATVHSHEGLNQMVYNRCVGTRYCSNNCPYKVRRYNYHNYQVGQNEIDAPFGKPYGNRNFQGAKDLPLLRMISNPNVTVRSRGVMEKCTYCVQRINQARINAKKDGRSIKDGEVQTACQQACPTQAITFGNVADPGSKIRKMKNDPRNYSLLKHLNTVPRTTYLGKVRNPNPKVGA